VRAVGDPGVDKVDWPPELRVFKTADTTHYVVATATSARACARRMRRSAVGSSLRGNSDSGNSRPNIWALGSAKTIGASDVACDAP